MSTTKKTTKHDLVKQHLLTHKSITSWDAIKLYKATRLAAIICNLNHKEGWVTKTIIMESKDGSRYGKYILVSSPLDKKKK
jgi:hypothetical protein